MNGGPLEAALASTTEEARQLPERNAEDEQLALEAASNATAFASLYGRYREPVFGYLRARFAPSKSTRRSVKTSG